MSLGSWIARLDAAEERFAASGGSRQSLDPRRRPATALGDLGRLLLPGLEEPLREAWTEALCATALAIGEHFPGNLFRDLDALAGHLARGAGDRGAGGPVWLAASSARLVDLHARFGCRTAIRFRYVHDFLYGYDWAKWVARDPAQRSSRGPYDLEFLEALFERGGELLGTLAAGGDGEYPSLAEGHSRNVFSFSREPADEERLLRALASEGSVPLAAWRADARGRWQEPFARLRLARASHLGVPVRPGARRHEAP